MATSLRHSAWHARAIPIPGTWPRGLVWPILGLAVLSLLVRTHDIGAKSLWFDETVSLTNARLPLPDLLAATRSDVHPPLYYVLLHLWIGIRESQGWARLLSALLSASATALTYLAGVRVLGSWRIGLLAALLLALSPADVAMAQESRMYPLLELLAIASVLALDLALDRDTWRAWLGYACVCALLPWTHYYGGFILVAHALALPILSRQQPRRLVHGLLAMGLAAMAFVPWLPSFVAQLHVTHTAFWIPPFTPTEIGETARQLTFSVAPDRGAFGDPLIVNTSYIYGALALAGSMLATARLQRSVVLPLIVAVPVVLAIGVSLVAVSVFFARYMLFALPEFTLLAAIGFVDLHSPFSVLPRRALQAAVLALVVTVDVQCIQTWFSDAYYARPDLQDSALVIQDGFQAGDLIVHTSLLTMLPVDYYLRTPYPAVDVEPPTRERLEASTHGAARVWLVRFEDTAYWGQTVDAEVEAMMPEDTLLAKWPLVGAAVYLYAPRTTATRQAVTSSNQ